MMVGVRCKAADRRSVSAFHSTPTVSIFAEMGKGELKKQVSDEPDTCFQFQFGNACSLTGNITVIGG